MFTGIVEEKGRISEIINGEYGSLKIVANKILEDIHIGDSIAVNGVCLTVTEYNKNYFVADVMGETVRRTGLKQLKIGSEVNLERAMSASGRFGGHIVSGHVDGTGEIVEIKNEGNAVWIGISACGNIMKHIVEKGSIAIDGISLTVAKAENDEFFVSIIPHTAKETILLNKKIGDIVNLETDVIAKYIERILDFNNTQQNENTKKSNIDLAFLEKCGF